jgi:hypothetical protein
MMQDQSVIELASGIVLDRSKLPNNAIGLNIVMSMAYASGKPVMIVDNATVFFSSVNLLDSLEKGTDDWKLIVEHHKLSINEDDLRILQRATELRKDILAKITPAWKFQGVLKGWDVSQIIVSGSGVVRRKGDNHQIGLMSLRRLWKRYAEYLVLGGASTMSVVASGYNKTAHFSHTEIVVGCQTIQRYEIEQFALSQGWDFPLPKS